MFYCAIAQLGLEMLLNGTMDQQMRDFGQARTALQAFADVLALQ